MPFKDNTRKIRMTLTIDRSLKHRVDLLALDQRRNISDQIGVMLEAQLAKEPKAPRQPQQSDN